LTVTVWLLLTERALKRPLELMEAYWVEDSDQEALTREPLKYAVYCACVFSGTLPLPWMESEYEPPPSSARTEGTAPGLNRVKINIHRKNFDIAPNIKLLLCLNVLDLGFGFFPRRFTFPGVDEANSQGEKLPSLRSRQ
jgi:hypothetical protein